MKNLMGLIITLFRRLTMGDSCFCCDSWCVAIRPSDITGNKTDDEKGHYKYKFESDDDIYNTLLSLHKAIHKKENILNKEYVSGLARISLLIAEHGNPKDERFVGLIQHLNRLIKHLLLDHIDKNDSYISQILRVNAHFRIAIIGNTFNENQILLHTLRNNIDILEHIIGSKVNQALFEDIYYIGPYNATIDERGADMFHGWHFNAHVFTVQNKEQLSEFGYQDSDINFYIHCDKNDESLVCSYCDKNGNQKILPYKIFSDAEFHTSQKDIDFRVFSAKWGDE